MICQAEIIVNESDIDDIFEAIYVTIISNKKVLGKGSSSIIDSNIDHAIFSKHNHLAGGNYIK